MKLNLTQLGSGMSSTESFEFPNETQGWYTSFYSG